MKKIADILTFELEATFEKAGYDKQYAKVTLSNRPDLCEYQCNGAMAAAKAYKKAPIMIANDVVEVLKESVCIEQVEAVNPGFINIILDGEFVASYLGKMSEQEKLGVEEPTKQKTIIVDYGGANVAKPLHVGHLRSAVIGESVKRIGKYVGHKMIGDVHLGDWGYQMGLVITELKKRKPELPYFDDQFEGEYPEESPFTITELEEIYPTASAYAKEHEDYKEEALQATFLLQNGHRGYTAIWKHIMNVSVADLKKNYGALNVEFDLWKGEADAQPYIPEMVEYMKKEGYAHIDQGALVVDVKEENDTKEIPPCMILKSDGAALYDTTDLATLIEREKLYHPDEVIYLADKRQELHFVQVFRCAKKTKIINENMELKFIGFGTMNGKDGKPFKTRDGGVMRLESLINDINEEMYKKIAENRTMSEEEARKTAQMVALSAMKYGDLSNQAAKDYVFDVERFISFEGNTGPYNLYTIVRIKSILAKYAESGKDAAKCKMKKPQTQSEKALMLEVAKFNNVIETAFEELAPHKICAYIYDLSNAFNRFYHETKILSEENEDRKAGFIALLLITKRALEACIDMLGFEAPERM
jgi:arginyl-tRNA synthetase